MSNPDTVIVVEDDPSVAEAIVRILRIAQLEPALFTAAEDALEAGLQHDASCMVVDVELPGMDGFEFCERVAASGRIPPFIIVTAFNEQVARAKATRAGAAAFLVKPFSGRTLVETVRRIARTASVLGPVPNP